MTNHCQNLRHGVPYGRHLPIETLEGLDMALPKPQFDVSSITLD